MVENGLPQLMAAFQQQAPEGVDIPQPNLQNEKMNGEDGRTNAYIDMGMTAENVAEKYDVKREDMDATRSARRSWP